MAKARTPVRPLKNEELPEPFKRVLPGLDVKKDVIKLSLHFYNESVVLQNHDTQGGGRAFRVVDPRDIAIALNPYLSYNTGLLPGSDEGMNVLWWENRKGGFCTALWWPLSVRRLSLQAEGAGQLERFEVPLPGLIFICRPGGAPWVFAAASRPKGPKEKVYHAPLANTYDDGQTCAGNVRYSNEIEKIPEDFLRSPFTRHADIDGRSRKYPRDITALWKELDKSKSAAYPLDDLVPHGLVSDLVGMMK